MDATTWAALALVLTAIGAVCTVLLWRSRGPAAGLRGMAWTLLPPAAWLTGTLRLAVDVGEDVGRWASRLVLSPSVWLGIALAGVSVVLFGATRAMRSRGVGTKPAAGGEAPRQVGPARPQEPVVDDDVAAILRKHGIS